MTATQAPFSVSKRGTSAVDRRVGKLIKAARLERGLSQTFLAERIGVTFQQVQKYELAGSRVSISRLEQIADVLDKPMSYFTGEKETTPGLAVALTDGGPIATFFQSKQGHRIAAAFAQLENHAQREMLCQLVEQTVDAQVRKP